MQEIYLKKLILKNYRNFAKFELNVPNKPIIIVGENGMGKTNILEAISLFYPGRGIRGAKFEEMCKEGFDNWSINSIFQSKLGMAELKCHYDQYSTKRIIEFNDARITTSELSRFLNIIWLTPQIENIFFEGASSRRKFLDRIVYNFYPQHATNINEYEYYISERSKVLQQNILDESWLKVLEEKIANISITIANLRIDTVNKMQFAINELDSEFPKAVLSVVGDVELKVKLHEIEEINAYIKAELLNTRIKDKFSKRTNFGVHRSDFLVIHAAKSKPAKLCSTGEQKAMLISIMLAQLNAGISETSTKPILLLDEIFVHLDDRRKEYLLQFLIESDLQVWITATDLKGIESLKSFSEIIAL